MKAFIALALVALVAAVSASNRPGDGHHSGPIADWYSCKGKKDGNYRNPRDCNRYIACLAETYAHDMPCATSDTWFDEGRNACLDKSETTCDLEEPSTTMPPTEETTPDDPPTTTTEEPIEEPVDECNPHDCMYDGWCTWWWHCVEGDDGRWVWYNQTCPDDLWFNPDKNSEHGGVCDVWDNLSGDWQAECAPPTQPTTTTPEPTTPEPECEYEGFECSAEYIYRDGKGNEHRFRCSDGLLWNNDTEQCDWAENVRDNDGNPCNGDGGCTDSDENGSCSSSSSESDENVKLPLIPLIPAPKP